MDLTWPEFERKPKFNKENRGYLLKKRLTISLSENASRQSEDGQTWHEKTFLRMMQQKNRRNKRSIYSGTSQFLQNGMRRYTPINPDEERYLVEDIYTLKDKNGRLKILLTCKDRVTGGGYCTNQFHSAFSTMRVNYSFDVSYLKDAIEIDKKVREFIEGMIVKPALDIPKK